MVYSGVMAFVAFIVLAAVAFVWYVRQMNRPNLFDSNVLVDTDLGLIAAAPESSNIVFADENLARLKDANDFDEIYPLE